MAFTYGFYNAIDHDRTYSATQFGEMFDGLINDGVYSTIGECFMTVPGSGVGVVVKSGRAWFNKTWSVNTADLPLDLGLPDLLLPRIDSVILEVDTRVAVRANAIKVVKGYPAVDPVPPGLTTNDGLYQYPLAYVKVAANATQITKSDITVVVGQTPCPFVTGILQSVPIDDMYQQWEGQFEEWFENLKTTLTEDVVGNLLYQLGQKVDKADKATKQDALTGTDDSKWMTPLRVKEMVDGTSKIGDIVFTGRSLTVEEPGKWLPCDGGDVKDTVYPELWKVCNYKFGFCLRNPLYAIIYTGVPEGPIMIGSTYSDALVPNGFIYAYDHNLAPDIRVEIGGKNFGNSSVVDLGSTSLGYALASPPIMTNSDCRILAVSGQDTNSNASRFRVSGFKSYWVSSRGSVSSKAWVSIPDSVATSAGLLKNAVFYYGSFLNENIIYTFLRVKVATGYVMYCVVDSSSMTSVRRVTYDGTNSPSNGILIGKKFYSVVGSTVYVYDPIANAYGNADSHSANRIKTLWDTNNKFLSGNANSYIGADKTNEYVMISLFGEPGLAYLHYDGVQFDCQISQEAYTSYLHFNPIKRIAIHGDRLHYFDPDDGIFYTAINHEVSNMSTNTYSMSTHIYDKPEVVLRRSSDAMLITLISPDKFKVFDTYAYTGLRYGGGCYIKAK